MHKNKKIKGLLAITLMQSTLACAQALTLDTKQNEQGLAVQANAYNRQAEPMKIKAFEPQNVEASKIVQIQSQCTKVSVKVNNINMALEGQLGRYQMQLEEWMINKKVALVIKNECEHDIYVDVRIDGKNTISGLAMKPEHSPKYWVKMGETVDVLGWQKKDKVQAFVLKKMGKEYIKGIVDYPLLDNGIEVLSFEPIKKYQTVSLLPIDEKASAVSKPSVMSKVSAEMMGSKPLETGQQNESFSKLTESQKVLWSDTMSEYMPYEFSMLNIGHESKLSAVGKVMQLRGSWYHEPMSVIKIKMQ